MKTLLLLRHAKSSWSEPSLDDHDRPLAKRGLRDAPRVARFLMDNGFVPEVILSSSAERAQATARSVAETADWAPQLRVTRRLYLAEPEQYLAVLAQVPNDVERVLMVGHNPGLESLASELAGVELTLVTGALVVFTVEVESWADVTLQTRAQIVSNQRPRELD